MNKAQQAEATRLFPSKRLWCGLMTADQKRYLSEFILSARVLAADVAQMTEVAIHALVEHKNAVEAAEAKVAKARLKVQAANDALDRAYNRRAKATVKREHAEKFYVNEARLRVAKKKMRSIK